jgi:hypothetical protein
MWIKNIGKITIITIFVVLMLVMISYASAINTKTNIEKKESPLFQVRVRTAIGEKMIDILNDIKTKFLGERLYFKPNEWLKSIFTKQNEIQCKWSSEEYCSSRTSSCACLQARYTNKDPYDSCRSYCVCQAEMRTYYDTNCPVFTCNNAKLCEGIK